MKKGDVVKNDKVNRGVREGEISMTRFLHAHCSTAAWHSLQWRETKNKGGLTEPEDWLEPKCLVSGWLRPDPFGSGSNLETFHVDPPRS
jgi:hypothetical protein